MEENDIENRKMQLKDLFKTDENARSVKLELEKTLESEPYVAHLYSEEKYEQLIFLELRKLNKNVETLMANIQGNNTRNKSNMITEIKPKPIAKSRTMKVK
jgi:hypothetical protein